MVSTMVIGPGMVILSLPLRVRARDPRLRLVHPAAQTQRRDHRRHHGVIAVVADAHLDLVLEVDAFDRFEETVHEVLPRLLAVADDVDAGVFLRLDPQQRRVALALGQRLTRELPLRPQLVGSASQDGLGRLPAMVVSNMSW